MNGYEPLQNEQYYHIYNRGINSCNIFRDVGNYAYFLGLYKKHIEAIATTYAWVLMPTHFHFLLKIKLPFPVLSGLSSSVPPTAITDPGSNLTSITSISPTVTPSTNPLNLSGFGGSVSPPVTPCTNPLNLSDLGGSVSPPVTPCTDPTGITAPPHQSFSNLFNAYSKAYNRRYHRHGGLFERPFRRKRVATERYFKQLILYIHNNPVHHNYCKSAYEYRWSSLNTYNQSNSPHIPREEIVGWFDNLSNFEFLHKQKSSICSLEDWD